MTQTKPAGRKSPRKHQVRTADPAQVRAGSPAAILAVIPHLLGFAPENSLVIVGTRPPAGEVKVSMRYDLPARPDADVAADIAEHAFAVLDSQRLTAAVVVGYGPDPLVRPLIGALRGAAHSYRIELRECLRVADGRYWSYLCRDERCCPAEGTVFDLADHPAAAAMAAAGDGIVRRRGDLAASIAPVAGIAAASMREATQRAERHVTQVIAKVRKSHRIGAARHMISCDGLAAVARLIGLYRAGEMYKTDYELAWLTVALKDVRIRDDAWARMDPRYCEEHRKLWTDAVRRAQPGYAAAPASLLAFVAWQAGNGALANIALDRALADDAGYSMAALLRDVIAAGTPPWLARVPMTPEEVAACYEHEGEDEPVAGGAPVPAMTGSARLG